MRAFACSILALAALVSAPAFAQSASAPSARDAVSRWRELPEAERDRLRKVYDDFRKLPKPEQDALRARAKESAKERERFENRLSPEEREALQALGPDARDQFLRGVLRELLAGHFRGGKPLVGRDKLREVLTLPAEKRREALKALLEGAGHKSIEQTLETATKKNLITREEKARIESLPLREAASETLAVRKQLVVAKLDENPESHPFHGDEEWQKVKDLPPEKFFERLEMARALRGSPKGGPGEGPASKRGHGWEESTRARAKAYFVSLGVAPDEAERLAAERPIFKIFETASRLRAEKGGTAPPFDDGRRARGR